MNKKQSLVFWVIGILLITWVFAIYRIDYIKRNPILHYYQSKMEKDHKEWEKEAFSNIEDKKNTLKLYPAPLKMKNKIIEEFKNVQIRNTLQFSLLISLIILIFGSLSIYTLRGKKK